MSNIDVAKVLLSDNAATRDAADELAGLVEEDSTIDFSRVRYMSGAFVDELINRLSADHIDKIIANAPEHISKLFQAVRNRRVAA